VAESRMVIEVELAGIDILDRGIIYLRVCLKHER